MYQELYIVSGDQIYLNCLEKGHPVCVCVCSYYSKDFEKVNTIFILHHFSNMSL